MDPIKDVERLALFRVEETVIPADKQLDPEDVELAQREITLPSFDMEQSIVNRCKDILKKEKEARDADAAREAQARTLREEQLNGGQHGPSITTTTSVENTNITPAVAIATPVSSSSSSSSSSSTAIHNIVDAPIAQPITSSGDAGVASELVDPFQVLSVSREASTNSSDGKEFDRREKIIMDMMEQTKLEQDVCVFYLESTEWDLEKALEFVKSMS